MKENRDQHTDQQKEKLSNENKNEPRSSAFNEPKNRDEKSTSNIEEANLEQERKEAMTERD